MRELSTKQQLRVLENEEPVALSRWQNVMTVGAGIKQAATMQ